MNIPRSRLVTVLGGGKTVTVTLQPGAEGIDTYTDEAAADTIRGGTTTFTVQSTAGSRKFVLAKFDLSSIPAGSTIISAKLGVRTDGNQTADRSIYIYPILVANSAWTEAGATWNYAVDGVTCWAGDAGSDGGTDAGCSVSGTDYNSTNIGQLFCPANSGVSFLIETYLTPAAVQAWLDGDNYGMAMRVSAGVLVMRSSDYATTTSHRPILTIKYSPP